jgi:hypothetical protein
VLLPRYRSLGKKDVLEDIIPFILFLTLVSVTLAAWMPGRWVFS